MSDAKGTWIPFSNELPPPPPLPDPAADLARLRAERAAERERVLREALQGLLECLGPGGYFPQAGQFRTDAARTALAATEPTP